MYVSSHVILLAKRPLEILEMNFTLLAKTSDGFENILVQTDLFTKYAMAIPTKTQSADKRREFHVLLMSGLKFFREIIYKVGTR